MPVERCTMANLGKGRTRNRGKNGREMTIREIKTAISAAAEAALAQRITGPGRGPYSGTPFSPAPGALGADGKLLADHVPGEAEQHHRGIIDHSRHVSSLGRR